MRYASFGMGKVENVASGANKYSESDATSRPLNLRPQYPYIVSCTDRVGLEGQRTISYLLRVPVISATGIARA